MFDPLKFQTRRKEKHVIQGATDLIFGSNSGAQSNSTAPLTQWKPYSFNSGGYSGVFDPKTQTYTLTPSAGLNTAVKGVQSGYGGLASDLQSLLPQVQAGAGKLTQSTQNIYDLARQQLENRRQAAISNLKGNLAKRRIQGSSFADAALSNANTDWSNALDQLTAQENTAQGKNFLQELDMTHNLLTEANTAKINSAQALLSELQGEGNLGAQLAGGLNNISATNAETQSKILSQMAMQNAQNRGSLFGIGLGSLVNTGLPFLGGGSPDLGAIGGGAIAGAAPTAAGAGSFMFG